MFFGGSALQAAEVDTVRLVHPFVASGSTVVIETLVVTKMVLASPENGNALVLVLGVPSAQQTRRRIRRFYQPRWSNMQELPVLKQVGQWL